MNTHSTHLLEECNSGCKMALSSLHQLSEYVVDGSLMHTIDAYKKKHEDLEARSAEMLLECGKCEKEPSKMASVFSFMTAEMKLLMKDDNHQITKLLMDGCNMGIQSISTARNDYPDAAKDVVSLAEGLIKLEEDFMRDLKQFM